VVIPLSSEKQNKENASTEMLLQMFMNYLSALPPSFFFVSSSTEKHQNQSGVNEGSIEVFHKH